MKTTRSTVALALCTILIGALLIAFPANATRWLVMAIGALFLVPGVVSVLTYLWQARSSKVRKFESSKDKPQTSKAFPFIGIGSVLFGGVLLAIPDSFHNALLYLLGAFLVLAGLVQAYRLFGLRKQYRLGATPYIVAALITLAGIAVIILNYKLGAAAPNTANADSNTDLPSIIFGVASVIYGLTEIIYAIQFRKSVKSQSPKVAESQSPVEENVEEIPPTPAEPEPTPTEVAETPAEPEPTPAEEVPVEAEPQPEPAVTTIEAEVTGEE